MRVEILNRYKGRPPGTVKDLPAAQARELIRAGHARKVSAGKSAPADDAPADEGAEE